MDTTTSCSLYQASMATMWANGVPGLTGSVSYRPRTASEASGSMNGNDLRASLARWFR